MGMHANGYACVRWTVEEKVLGKKVIGKIRLQRCWESVGCEGGDAINVTGAEMGVVDRV